MSKHDQELDYTEEQPSPFNLGNLLFGFLGAWCASIVCLMVYTSEVPDRAPAEEPAPLKNPQNAPEPFNPEAYLLSFNSIHLEK